MQKTLQTNANQYKKQCKPMQTIAKPTQNQCKPMLTNEKSTHAYRTTIADRRPNSFLPKHGVGPEGGWVEL